MWLLDKFDTLAAMPAKLGIPVLGREISLLQEDMVPAVLDGLGAGQPETVLFCNVHMLMLARSDPALARAMARAEWVFADGVPVAWLQSRLSGRRAETLRGYVAMRQLCGLAERRGFGVGLYGASDAMLDRLTARLKGEFPRLEIRFRHAPPRIDDEFMEDPEILDRIDEADVRYLFVGLGCPKQEKWMDRHRERLPCTLLGVGAAFDWLAGVEPMAPKWMERRGLGWLHRWLHHPLRFFWRYLIYNTQFLFLATREWIRGARA